MWTLVAVLLAKHLAAHFFLSSHGFDSKVKLLIPSLRSNMSSIEMQLVYIADVLVINDMLVLIFQSMIIQASEQEGIDINGHVEKIMDYVTRVFNAHRVDK